MFGLRAGGATLLCALVAAGCASGGETAGPARFGPPVPQPDQPPTVVATSTTLQPVADPPVRALLVGDSTLLAVLRYNTFEALQGFEYVYDAKSCRTLGVPSCGEAPVPANTVETITSATGSFDVVVVMAGYDEWWTSFPSSFDAVVAAARAQGAEHTIWLSYREGVGYTAPDGSTANEAFVKNNETLRAKTALPEYDDVVLADWYGYSADPALSDQWLADDGIHLTRTGAWAVADYISRTIAWLDGNSCPQPWVAGGPVDTPCPDPDAHAPVTDVRALYP